jgi:hypothetical protein
MKKKLVINEGDYISDDLKLLEINEFSQNLFIQREINKETYNDLKNKYG